MGKEHLNVLLTFDDDSRTGHVVVTQASQSEAWDLIYDERFSSWSDIFPVWLLSRLWLAIQTEVVEPSPS